MMNPFLLLLLVSMEDVCGYPHHSNYQESLNRSLQDKVLLLRQPRDTDFLLLTAASAASQYLINTQGLIQNADHKIYFVNFEMTVKNFLKHKLLRPVVSVKHGYTSTPITSISHCSYGTLAGHKAGYSVYGSAGLACWEVHDTQLRICMSWDVPLRPSCPSLTLGIYRNYGQNYNETKMFRELHTDRNKDALENNRSNSDYTQVTHHDNDTPESHAAFFTSCSKNQEFYLRKENIVMSGSFVTNSYTTMYMVRIEHEGMPLECPIINKSVLTKA